MKIDLVDLFFAYLLVMVGIVFFAWMLFNLRLQRQRAKERRWIACRTCKEPFKERDAVFTARCPHCGARNRAPFLPAAAPGKKRPARARA